MTDKFRAWDKTKHRWEIILIDNRGTINHYAQDPFMLFGPLKPEFFTIQFFTGFKDKNGKDIYEGDIVKYIADMHRIVCDEIVYLKGVVVFEDGAFWVKELAEDGDFEFESRETRLVRNFIDYWWDGENEGDKDGRHEIEVLGNICEMPELMKGKV